MKNILLITLMFSFNTFAQDIGVKASGDKILADDVNSLQEQIKNLRTLLESQPKFLSGDFVFTNGCGVSVGNPCIIDISAGNFSNDPRCFISLQAPDASGYREQVLVKTNSTSTLEIWRGNYQNGGTTIQGSYLCIED